MPSTDETLRTPRIRQVTCATCRGYAWNEFHDPVQQADGWHHPACRLYFKFDARGIPTTVVGSTNSR